MFNLNIDDLEKEKKILVYMCVLSNAKYMLMVI